MKIFSLLKDPKRIFKGLLFRYGSFIPDKIYLKSLYHLEMGQKLNLKNPQKFSEKLQWLKLYDRNPEYTKLVDKAAVKKIVADKIGNEHIIPTIGLWEKVEDIEWKKLPNQFVLKTTHGGGGNGVVICRDISSFNFEEAKKKLRRALNSDIYKSYREWPYKDTPRRIIAEKYMGAFDDNEIPDYKWFCFNGTPLYCQVIRDRNSNETIDFYDIEWNHQDFTGLNPKGYNYKNGLKPVEKPINLSQHLKIASLLTYNIPFARVDLYDINGDIYFGEITFYPASGLGNFDPIIWNDKIGAFLEIK